MSEGPNTVSRLSSSYERLSVLTTLSSSSILTVRCGMVSEGMRPMGMYMALRMERGRIWENREHKRQRMEKRERREARVERE